MKTGETLCVMHSIMALREVNSMTRTERIKKYILGYAPEICTERGKIYTEECLKAPGQPVVIRRARAFKRMMNEMTI